MDLLAAAKQREQEALNRAVMSLEEAREELQALEAAKGIIRKKVGQCRSSWERHVAAVRQLAGDLAGGEGEGEAGGVGGGVGIREMERRLEDCEKAAAAYREYVGAWKELEGMMRQLKELHQGM